jgi:hypothetical protein
VALADDQDRQAAVRHQKDGEVMMMRRLYLGGDNSNGGARFPVEDVRRVVDRYFLGYTLLQAEGVWRGGTEQTWIIEVAGNEDVEKLHTDDSPIRLLIEALKEQFSQESIGVGTGEFWIK